MALRIRTLARALSPASLLSPPVLPSRGASVALHAYPCVAPGEPQFRQGTHCLANPAVPWPHCLANPALPWPHCLANPALPWPVQELWLRGRVGRAEEAPVLAAAFHCSPAPGAPQPSAGRGGSGAGPPPELQPKHEGSSAASSPLGSPSPSKGSSWLGKVQSLVWGQGRSEQDQWSVAVALDAFAKQLGQARTFGSLATFGRGLPRGGEAAVTASLKQQQDIALALASLLRPSSSPFASPSRPPGSGSNPQLSQDGSLPAIPGPLREAAAAQAGCRTADVDSFLLKFAWFCQASAKMEALRAQGKPVPRTFQEVEEIMGGSWARGIGGAQGAAPSRNSACPCGSGKKFKRCCGTAAA